jgi:hypothetical protein
LDNHRRWGASDDHKGRAWWKWLFWLFVACLVIVLYSLGLSALQAARRQFAGGYLQGKRHA